MFDEEGAVNGVADASPADSGFGLDDVYGQEEFLDDVEGGDVDSTGPAHLATRTPDSRHWRDGSAAPSTTNASEVGSPDDKGIEEPENLDVGGDGEAGSAREAFIPRDRFDQVHGRAQQLEQELLFQREQTALASRAMTAGYRDVGQFQHDDAWAKANNYQSIEEYLGERDQQQQLEKKKAKIQEDADAALLRGKISEDYRDEYIRDRQERLRTQQELAQVRGLLQSVQRSSLDQTIASARAQFDHVDADQWAQIERLCRDIGRPDAVQRVISTFAPAVQSAKKTAAERALVEQNARRQANSNGAPPPEGRGGGQAPPQLPKVSPQQAKSRLLSELLGFRR